MLMRTGVGAFALLVGLAAVAGFLFGAGAYQLGRSPAAALAVAAIVAGLVAVLLASPIPGGREALSALPRAHIRGDGVVLPFGTYGLTPVYGTHGPDGRFDFVGFAPSDTFGRDGLAIEPTEQRVAYAREVLVESIARERGERPTFETTDGRGPAAEAAAEDPTTAGRLDLAMDLLFCTPVVGPYRSAAWASGETPREVWEEIRRMADEHLDGPDDEPRDEWRDDDGPNVEPPAPAGPGSLVVDAAPPVDDLGLVVECGCLAPSVYTLHVHGRGILERQEGPLEPAALLDALLFALFGPAPLAPAWTAAEQARWKADELAERSAGREGMLFIDADGSQHMLREDADGVLRYDPPRPIAEIGRLPFVDVKPGPGLTVIDEAADVSPDLWDAIGSLNSANICHLPLPPAAGPFDAICADVFPSKINPTLEHGFGPDAPAVIESTLNPTAAVDPAAIAKALDGPELSASPYALEDAWSKMIARVGASIDAEIARRAVVAPNAFRELSPAEKQEHAADVIRILRVVNTDGASVPAPPAAMFFAHVFTGRPSNN
jgi:hypothetical protein